MKGDKLATVVHLASPEGSEDTLSEQALIPAFFFIPRCWRHPEAARGTATELGGRFAVLFAQLIPC